MDIGGASTELISVSMSPFKIKSSISLPFGAVRVTDWIAQGEWENQKNKLDERFSQHFVHYKVDSLVCVAGTMTSIANMFLENSTFDESKVNGTRISYQKFKDVYQNNLNLSPELYLEKYPFLGKRAKSIYGGLEVSNYVLDRLQVKEVLVSTYGLRYGSLVEGGIKSEFLYI
jgi:exopolyphosphatase/guanosine-5'-triphosphate,3'-diphosphate pyrophosphatase